MENEKKQREYETLRKLIDNEKNNEMLTVLLSRALKILNEMGTK